MPKVHPDIFKKGVDPQKEVSGIPISCSSIITVINVGEMNLPS